MDRRLEQRLNDAAGFGNCLRCTFLSSGPAELCYACARRSMEGLAASDSRCTVCDRPFEGTETGCHNPLCNWGGRYFERNFAIAMRSGVLEAALNRYKDGHVSWALVFGRILAGFLEQDAATFGTFDLIVSSPTFVGERGRSFDHTSLVLECAADELVFVRTWPFDALDDPSIVKTGPTDPMRGGYWDRVRIAETQLRPVLSVAHPERTRGKRILVYDDVFTDGRTLDEVARALRLQGQAQTICGVTLCRQPWRGG